MNSNSLLDLPPVIPSSINFADLTAAERIQLLSEHAGGRMIASTSFGIQAAVMLHLIHEHAPGTPVVFIDTGFLFPETYEYVETLRARLPKLDLRVYLPAISAARLHAVWGNLWEGTAEDKQLYATVTKIEPMNRALQETGAAVWLSGLRRVQSMSRRDRPFIERQNRTFKAYPILDWSEDQVEIYLRRQDLPRHPLEEKGYVTMGDWHSTQPASNLPAESTRFNGEKYECGLHLDSGTPRFRI